METDQQLHTSTYSGSMTSNYNERRVSVIKRKLTGNDLIDNLLHGRAIPVHHRKRKSYNKLSAGSQMKTLFPFMLTLLFIYISLVDFSEGNPKHLCLRHCHMCKEIYGRHFRIHLCKDDCIESRGRIIPDCLDWNSIEDYLIFTP